MTSLEFAEAVRCLSGAARRAGYRAPSFRSRPRGNRHRTIRRRVDGSATIAVALRQRPMPAVLGDLIDGIIAANALSGEPAAELRDRLWLSVLPVLDQALSDQALSDQARSDLPNNAQPNNAQPNNVVPFAA